MFLSLFLLGVSLVSERVPSRNPPRNRSWHRHCTPAIPPASRTEFFPMGEMVERPAGGSPRAPGPLPAVAPKSCRMRPSRSRFTHQPTWPPWPRVSRPFQVSTPSTPSLPASRPLVACTEFHAHVKLDGWLMLRKPPSARIAARFCVNGSTGFAQCWKKPSLPPGFRTVMPWAPPWLVGPMPNSARKICARSRPCWGAHLEAGEFGVGEHREAAVAQRCGPLRDARVLGGAVALLVQ